FFPLEQPTETLRTRPRSSLRRLPGLQAAHLRFFRGRFRCPRLHEAGSASQRSLDDGTMFISFKYSKANWVVKNQTTTRTAVHLLLYVTSPVFGRSFSPDHNWTKQSSKSSKESSFTSPEHHWAAPAAIPAQAREKLCPRFELDGSLVKFGSRGKPAATLARVRPIETVINLAVGSG